MYQSIANNPIYSRVDSIESRLSTFASTAGLMAVQEQMMELATIQTVDHVIERINKLPEKFLTKVEYEVIQEGLRGEFDEKLENKISIKDLNETISNVYQDMNKSEENLKKQLDKFKKSIKDIENKMEEVEEMTNMQNEIIKQKVGFDEIERVWKNFERYSMYDDLKDLYLKTVPEIFKFEQKIEEHRHDIERQNEILRRFDEVISDKVSKANMREMAQENVKKFAPLDDYLEHKADLLNRVETNFVSIQDLKDMINILGKNITKDIFAAVKRATQHLNKGPLMTSSGAGDFTQLAEEIKLLVSQKAEKQQIVDLSLGKANKIDTELAMRWIEIINRQLKQILVLITEMIRFSVHKKDLKVFEGDQHVQYSKGFLLQQALLISSWVNKFHTQSINEYFLETSNGVTDVNWTPPEVIAFQRYAEEKLQTVDLDVLIARNNALAQNMKMRSKSVVQGGGNSLAMTQSNFQASQSSPRQQHNNLLSPKQSASIQQSPRAAFVNNKVQYSNQLCEKRASINADYPMTTSMKKVRVNSGMRTLNNESTNLVFNEQQSNIDDITITRPSLQEYSISSTSKQVSNNNKSIFNKTINHNFGFLSPIKDSSITTRLGGITPQQKVKLNQSTEKHLSTQSVTQNIKTKGLLLNSQQQQQLQQQQVRQSINLPGIGNK